MIENKQLAACIQEYVERYGGSKYDDEESELKLEQWIWESMATDERIEGHSEYLAEIRELRSSGEVQRLLIEHRNARRSRE